MPHLLYSVEGGVVLLADLERCEIVLLVGNSYVGVLKDVGNFSDLW